MTVSSQMPKPDPATWVDQYGDVLYRFALLRVKDPHVAEDLVQEALISALESLPNYKGGSSIQTWLIGILKHKIYDFFRKKSKEVPTSDLTGFTEVSEEDAISRLDHDHAEAPRVRDDPHNIMENREFWKKFLVCLDGLPPNFRRAFAMRELDGLKTDEICKIMEITATNLWVILHRARMRLRDCLNANWFTR